MPKNIRVHLALFVVAVLYGGNYSIAKVAMPVFIEPFAFIVLRVIAATLLFWAVDLFNTSERIDKKDIWLLVKCSFFGASANMLFFFQGLSMTNPINASVIMTMSPIAVVVVAYSQGQEKLSLQKLVGVIIGALGAFFLITKNGISLSNETLVGDFLILLNSTFYAAYLVIVRPLMQKYKPLTVIKWVFLLGIVMNLPFGLEGLISTRWTEIPIQAWLSIVYVVIGATFIVYLMNTWSLSHVSSSIVGSYIYLQPVISTIIAITFRGDVLTLHTVLMALFIMAGVYLISYQKKVKPG